jgi:hypothetical protein
VRFSASSIQFSSKLALATRSCSSHRSCALTQVCNQLPVVVAELGKHVQRRDKIRIVVEDRDWTSPSWSNPLSSLLMRLCPGRRRHKC